MDTPIAKNLELANQMARYDNACKRLLSYKSILAQILKGCVKEFEDYDVYEIAEKCIEGEPAVSDTAVNPDEIAIKGSNTVDSTMSEGTVMYDILFDAVADERIKLIINIEAQNDYRPGYPLVKRALYYCARMLSAQYGKEFVNSDYGNIKKVYSIFICTDPPKKYENTIVKYSMKKTDMLGEVTEDEENYDLQTVVMICLGENYDKKDLLGLLNTLLISDKPVEERQRILQEDYKIKMKGEINDMCNVSTGILRRGINQGIEQGREKERKELLASMLSSGAINKETYDEFLNKSTEQNPPKTE